MSLTPQQVYRELFRASRVAFQGDLRILGSAREKIRQAFRDPSFTPPGLEPKRKSSRSITNESSQPSPFAPRAVDKKYQQPSEQQFLSLQDKLQHGHQVAKFLVANIVQGSRPAEHQSQQQEKFHLRIHKGTELGFNDSINDPLRNARIVRPGTAAASGCCGGGGGQKQSKDELN